MERSVYGKINELVSRNFDKVVEWRRTIHRYPELSNSEEKTAGLVASVLEGLGLEVSRNVGGHGVVGLLRGNDKGKTVGLRADMDALPMKEETGLPFASEVPGVMHACGHDTHTAMLLGAACVLSDPELRSELPGNVKFIFQPAEEANPTGGAPGMIADGVLENPYVDGLFALHVWPTYETGHVVIRPGAQTAASDRFYMTIHGKAAHGSAPSQGIDAIMIAAQVICGMQSIVSRSISPIDSAVLTIGTIKGGYRYNVIADYVDLEGTVRTLREAIQNRMPDLINRTASGIAEGLGGTCDVRYVKGYPPMANDTDMVELVRKSVTASMGNGAFVHMEQPELGGEDFAFFAQRRPAAMAWIGCRPVGSALDSVGVLHNTHFNPDENCFPVGMKFYTCCAMDFLAK